MDKLHALFDMSKKMKMLYDLLGFNAVGVLLYNVEYYIDPSIEINSPCI